MRANNLPFCHTKIVATLGPSSTDKKSIEALVEAGASIFRMNFSHGTQEDHAARYKIIRDLEHGFSRPLGLFMDLQGPKLRVGTFRDGSVFLEKGQRFTLDMNPVPGDRTRVNLPHAEIFQILKNGAELLFDDGKIRVKVISHTSDTADVELLTSGILSDKKGVNVPNLALPISALTEKDLKDLDFGLSLGVDWVALSFVQTPDDVRAARAIIGQQAGIIAKIEKPAALHHLEEIIALSDAIMVARGDLGVEMNPEDVPILQKQIVRACRQAGKPVIVATQMLESMITSPSPTRAEASDVATAIYDGADAVMLSAESASGQYPQEAVAMMQRIARRVQKDPLYQALMVANHPTPQPTQEDAITKAARQVTETIHATAIVTFTETGTTARRAARERPLVPILGLTPNLQTWRQLSLVWGVSPHLTEACERFSEIEELCRKLAKETGFCHKEDTVVLTAGLPFRQPGTTNILRIISI